MSEQNKHADLGSSEAVTQEKDNIILRSTKTISYDDTVLIEEVDVVFAESMMTMRC